MITIPASPYCELARWALDRLEVGYREEAHVPVLARAATRRYGGGVEAPVLVAPERTLVNAQEVLDYYDERSPEDQRLYPSDDDARSEVERLVSLFYDQLGPAVRAWNYAYLLPARSTMLRSWTTGVGPFESLLASLSYPRLAAKVRQGLAIGPHTIVEQRAKIDAIFDQVEALLADGRRFLTGDQLTAADLSLAALAAPTVLPSEFGGPNPAIDELPPALQSAIQELRARPAGQFIARMYDEHRPRRTEETTSLGRIVRTPTWRDKLAATLTSPALLLPVFGLLRRFAPILTLGRRAVLTRYADVREVLTRDGEFTIEPINKLRIERIDGPFILGMDRSPRYERECGALSEAVHPGDAERIRAFVADTAAELIEQARPAGRIDVVNGYARVVSTRLVASYFGVTGPSERMLRRWLRDLFHEAFLNINDDLGVRGAGLRAAEELQEFVDAEIPRRKAMPEADRPDDVLSRLIALQGRYDWLDDEAIRRNINGVIVGAVDTTTSFVTLALYELFQRKTELRGAQQAAQRGDIELVRRYAWEAARFRPFTPLMFRYASQPTDLAPDGPAPRRIPGEKYLVLGTLGAMHDPAAFATPGAFRTDRDADYLHFGHGLHRCYGYAINGIQIPELAAALLREPKLRLARGSDGVVAFDGPFPDRLIVEF
jgi:cytochrome P450/glutathione S-transferase